MIEYPNEIEADKVIKASGNGYIIRATQETALLGLSAGDEVHIKITVLNRREGAL